MIWHAVVAVLLLCSSAAAQPEPTETDPYEHAHPTTGEPGVWIPVWLQQIELARKAALGTCQEQRTKRDEQLTERTAEIESRKQAQLEVMAANSGLKETLAITSLQREEAEDRAETRLIWAWTSTGAAAVAVLVAVLSVAL